MRSSSPRYDRRPSGSLSLPSSADHPDRPIDSATYRGLFPVPYGHVHHVQMGSNGQGQPQAPIGGLYEARLSPFDRVVRRMRAIRFGLRSQGVDAVPEGCIGCGYRLQDRDWANKQSKRS